MKEKERCVLFLERKKITSLLDGRKIKYVFVAHTCSLVLEEKKQAFAQAECTYYIHTVLQIMQYGSLTFLHYRVFNSYSHMFYFFWKKKRFNMSAYRELIRQQPWGCSTSQSISNQHLICSPILFLRAES